MSVNTSRASIRPAFQYLIVMKSIHVQLGILEHCEANVRRLIDNRSQFLHSHGCDVFSEYSEADAVRFIDELLCALSVRDELYILAFQHVLARFAVYAVVHELVEVFLKIVPCLGA